jgi:preprotein translocase subunit SecG
MSTFLIVLILIASILLILAVLVQNPKSGMAANFGASNQVMGVRQTADFLEKFTWGTAAVILVLSLIFTLPTFSSNTGKVENNVGGKQTEQTDNKTATEDGAATEAAVPAQAATEAAANE